MSSAREIAEMIENLPYTVIEDADATGPNTVKVGSSTTAVELPALIPVEDGDRALVATIEGARIILGPIDKPGGSATDLFVTASTAGVLDWNDVSNTKPGTGPTLLLGTASNGPGLGGFFYCTTYAFSVGDGSGNCTQMAVPYSLATTGRPFMFRHRYSGVWGPWTNLGGRLGFRGKRTASLNIPSRTYTGLTCNTEDEDLVGMFSGSLATIPAGGDGFWSLFAVFKFSVFAMGTVQVQRVVSSRYGDLDFNDYIGNGHVLFRQTMWCEAGDTFRLQFYQSSGSTRTVTSGHWQMERVA